MDTVIVASRIKFDTLVEAIYTALSHDLISLEFFCEGQARMLEQVAKMIRLRLEERN